MLSFFDDKNEISSEDLVEHIFFKGSEFIYKVNSVKYDIASNGGCILVSYPLDQDLDLMEVDKSLVSTIAVHRADGRRICRINSKDVISASFLPDEKILKIYNDGRFGIVNPFDEKNLIRNEIIIEFPHKSKFMSNGEQKGIKFVKTFQNSFVLFTNTQNLFYFYDLENLKTKKLLEPESDHVYNIFNENSICSYTKAYKKTSYFLIACLKTGIITLEFEGNTISKKDKLLQNIPDQIMHLSVNYKKTIFAALTINSDLHIFKTDNMSYQKKFHLGFSEIDMRSFNSIEWIEDHTAVLCFQRQFYLIYNGLREPELVTGFASGVNVDKSGLLLYKTEIDGLRIIKMHRKETPNILIRRKSRSYENVTSVYSITPGRVLYEYYKRTLKLQPPENEEIMQNKDMLKQGIEEILDAAKFEMKESKQRKFILAASEGKIFLNDQDFNHNIIYQFCKLVKLFTSLAKKTMRAISFDQFETLVPGDLQKLIQYLLNCGQYELAFYCCIYNNKEQNFLSEIFKKWVNDLIINNSDDEKIAQKIISTYKSLEKMNKNIQSIILIDAAYQAFNLNREKIIEPLLKEPNPALLKIALYLNLNSFEKALEESVNTHDSNCIYGVLNKIVERYKEKKAIEIILKTKNLIIFDHFFRYLSVNSDPLSLKEFVDGLDDYRQFFIKQFESQVNSKKFLNYKGKGEMLIQILRGTESRHVQSKKSSLAGINQIVKQVELGMQIDSEGKANFKPTVDVIMQTCFDAKKSEYLEQADYKFDDNFIAKAKILGLSDKKQHLLRIDYMLRNLQGKNIDTLIKYISRTKSYGYSLVQLRLLFDNLNHSDDFLFALELYPYDDTFGFTMGRKMFYEAASLSITANRRDGFEQAISDVRGVGKKEKLLERAAKIFK